MVCFYYIFYILVKFEGDQKLIVMLLNKCLILNFCDLKKCIKNNFIDRIINNI